MIEETRSHNASLPLQALERIEGVCLEFEAAWKKGRQPRIEDYVGESQGAVRRELLRELLLLDLDYRSRSDDLPREGEYQARFPQDIQLVSDVFRELSTGAAVTETGPSPAAPVSCGQILPRQFGDYELLEVLGEGGMGVVYRARQQTPDRIVALKIIRPDRLAAVAPERREKVIERFHVETQATANLEHAHIVPVYEVGQIEGQPFYSMRYIPGRGLEQVLRDGPLAGQDAAALLEPVARALHYAHRRDIVHRDIKPRNILLDTDGKPYVADFGLAKSFAAAQDLTQTAEAIGTPAYMSPEQARGQAGVDHRTDVYSLGATLYELLTGRPPFRAATVAETQRQVIENEPVPPRQLNPAADRDLETICLKCLEKEPARRYATADELADELQRFGRGEPIRARPLSVLGRSAKWCRRKPWMATALSLVLIIAMVAPVVALLQHRLAVSNAGLVGQRDNLIGKLTKAYKDLEQSHQLTTAQKEKLRHGLLNSDLARIGDLMAISNVRLVRLFLERHIPQPGEQDFRSFVWHYWWRECHQEDYSLPLATLGAVAAISPDGKLLAAIGPDRQLVVVDLPSCRSFRTSLATQETAKLTFVKSLTFTDDRHLVTVSGETVSLGQPEAARRSIASLLPKVVCWSIEQKAGEYVIRPQHETDLDVDALSLASNRTAVANRAILGKVPSLGAMVSIGAAAIAPDGSHVATVTSLRDFAALAAGRPVMRDVVVLWNCRSGKLVETLELRSPPADVPFAVRLAWSGDWLVSGNSRGTLQIWRRSPAGSFESCARFREGDGQGSRSNDGVVCIAFANRPGRVAAVDRTGRATLFDLSDKSETILFDGQGRTVTSFAFLPDDVPVVAVGRTILVRQPIRGSEETWTVYKGHESDVMWVGYSSACNALFSLGQDRMLKRWLLPGAQPVCSLPGIVISPDFRTTVIATNRTRIEKNKVGIPVVEHDWRLQLRDAETGDLREPIFGESQPSPARGPDAFHFLPRRRVLLSYDLGRLIQIWNPSNGEKEFEYRSGQRERTLRFAESSDGQLVALGYGSKIFLLDAQTWETVASLPVKYVADVCITPRSELLIADTSNHVGRWTIAKEPKQLERFSLPAPSGQLWWFTADGRRALGASKDGEMQLWDLKTRRVVQSFLGHSSWIRAIALHPDGRTLASASGGAIKLWDLATGEEKLTLEAPATTLQFSADGHTLVAAGTDEKIRFWRATPDTAIVTRQAAKAAKENGDR